jgi:broad specificity phosphatase PhoE
MAKLYLVRHGRPAAGWGEDLDPGLDENGLEQARSTARDIARRSAPMPVYTSPLRRCRETAAPLATLWNQSAIIMQAVAEIPAPPLDLSARRDWLTVATEGTWQDLNDTAPAGSIDYLAWRRDLVTSLTALPHDCVIFTHFIAINVAVGAAQGSLDVVCFRPDHASITILDTSGPRPLVSELGRQGQASFLIQPHTRPDHG